MIRSIAANLGDVMEIEKNELCLEKYRRVKVMLDVMKPLRIYQRIKNKEGKVIKVDYKYERLPFLCFMCGIMGYNEKDCPNYDSEDNSNELGWGVWLNASPPKGRN
ncbi:hypothetical protein RDABS01_016884 [Bienertia sinuspersici]